MAPHQYSKIDACVLNNMRFDGMLDILCMVFCDRIL